MNGIYLTGWITLANPLVLIWGAVAAAPILIHLLSRRRYMETPWAATRFLEAAFRKRSRRVRIEQIILMAIRVLIVLLTVLAAADPMLRALALSDSGQADDAIPPTHTILVIDGSFSMRYAREDDTLFEQAILRAEKIVRETRRGDGITVILMANPPKAIIARPAFEKEDVIRQLQQVEPMYSDAPLATTLDLIDATLKATEVDFSRLEKTRVVFLTDFQNETWQAAAKESVRKQLLQLGKKARITLTDFGRAARENAAVVSLECDEPFVIAGRDATIAARIKNFSSSDLLHRSLELLVDGTSVSTQSIDIPADGERVVLLEHNFSTEGERVAEVRLQRDRLPVDNRARIVVPVRSELRVLCVSGRYDPANYIGRTLFPGSDADIPVLCESISESELLERDLNLYDCLILDNISRFSREEATRMSAYADAGGGIVFFLGERTNPGSWNSVLSSTEPPLLPARIGALSPPDLYFISPGDYAHPIIAPWKGVRAFLTSTPIIRYFQVTPVPDKQSQVVAELNNGGDPLMVTRRAGRGNVILITTTPTTSATVKFKGEDTPWSGLSGSPAFLPLVQQALAHAVAGNTRRQDIRVSEPITATVPVAGASTRASVIMPGGKSVPLSLERQQGLYAFTFSDTHQPGVYTVRLSGPAGLDIKFAVNLQPRESDLARSDKSILQGLELNERGAPEPEEDTARPAPPYPAWFRIPLVLVFGLLFLEIFLARRFGAEG